MGFKESKEKVRINYTGLYKGKTLLQKGVSAKGKEWKLYEIEMSSGLQNEQWGRKFKIFASDNNGFDLLDDLEMEPTELWVEKGYAVNSHGKVYETRNVLNIKKGKKEDVSMYKIETIPESIYEELGMPLPEDYGKVAQKTKTTPEKLQIELTEAQKLGIINDLKIGDITPEDTITIGANKVVVKEVFPDYQKYM